MDKIAKIIFISAWLPGSLLSIVLFYISTDLRILTVGVSDELFTGVLLFNIGFTIFGLLIVFSRKTKNHSIEFKFYDYISRASLYAGLFVLLVLTVAYKGNFFIDRTEIYLNIHIPAALFYGTLYFIVPVVLLGAFIDVIIKNRIITPVSFIAILVQLILQSRISILMILLISFLLTERYKSKIDVLYFIIALVIIQLTLTIARGVSLQEMSSVLLLYLLNGPSILQFHIYNASSIIHDQINSFRFINLIDIVIAFFESTFIDGSVSTNSFTIKAGKELFEQVNILDTGQTGMAFGTFYYTIYWIFQDINLLSGFVFGFIVYILYYFNRNNYINQRVISAFFFTIFAMPLMAPWLQSPYLSSLIFLFLFSSLYKSLPKRRKI